LFSPFCFCLSISLSCLFSIFLSVSFFPSLFLHLLLLSLFLSLSMFSTYILFLSLYVSLVFSFPSHFVNCMSVVCLCKTWRDLFTKPTTPSLNEGLEQVIKCVISVRENGLWCHWENVSKLQLFYLNFRICICHHYVAHKINRVLSWKNSLNILSVWRCHYKIWDILFKTTKIELLITFRPPNLKEYDMDVKTNNDFLHIL
jgi:hypothetical protein